jgi:hypothetical protein
MTFNFKCLLLFGLLAGPCLASECGVSNLDGSYIIEGDFRSFSEWVLTFKKGRLVSSRTDDLPAEDWPAEFTPDRSNSKTLRIRQTTQGSDALLETAVQMEIRKCEGSRAVLSPVAAWSVVVDQSGIGNHSIYVPSVTVRRQ